MQLESVNKESAFFLRKFQFKANSIVEIENTIGILDSYNWYLDALDQCISFAKNLLEFLCSSMKCLTLSVLERYFNQFTKVVFENIKY